MELNILITIKIGRMRVTTRKSNKQRRTRRKRESSKRWTRARLTIWLRINNKLLKINSFRLTIELMLKIIIMVNKIHNITAILTVSHRITNINKMIQWASRHMSMETTSSTRETRGSSKTSLSEGLTALQFCKIAA
jgi:hypothetical protein